MRKLIARLWEAGSGRIVAWRRRRLAGDAGMNTAEYAVGTMAAVAFAGVLLKVVTSASVQRALTGIIEGALK
ncbi:hypothetical protein GCM10022251_66910 [Phytohabitans flavus]|uniref:DUF4244 domain-containing protein n=1 Tax=Phytohabitans flavus TaxID=1076124 RepID=A0A6F8Y4Q2_9ACTN|nr:hypothetical protein Pflav_075020 [Phytohabitans flavus]